jgi:hypothetical protein
MNADLVYGLLLANILVCYIIGLRVRAIRHDVECMHDFVHSLREHPFFAAFIDAERFSHALEKKIEEVRKQDSEVPDPFKEWDES